MAALSAAALELADPSTSSLLSLTSSGSLDLSEACPVCQHAPVSGDDCKPNKNLRTTISAYIKTEQNKRQKAQREKDAKLAAATPVAAPAAPTTPTPAAESTIETNGDAPVEEVDVAPATPASERAHSAQGEVELPLESTENAATNDDNEATAEADDEQDGDYEDDDDVVITTHKPESEVKQDAQRHNGYNEPEQGHGEVQEQQSDMNGHQQIFNNFDQNNQQAGYGNGGMDFGNTNNFNPMMGMGMGGFGMGMGMPNMMGMPGMMDPSMMFGNGGGFGGMDMSMMNMAMGPMGMGGFGGMMGGGGGFGGGPGGFHGQNGYNNQNFGNSMNQQFRKDRGGFGGGRPYGRGNYNRGRGYNNNGYNRGRGGYGAGFQNQHQNENFGQQQQYGQQCGQGQNQGTVNQRQQAGGSVNEYPGPSGRRASPSYEPINGTANTTTKTARDQDMEQPEQDDTNGKENANTTVNDGEEVTQSVEEHVAPNGEAAYEVDAQGGATDEAMTGDATMQQQQNQVDESELPDTNEMDTSGMNGDPQQDPHVYDNLQAYDQNFGSGARGRGGARGGSRAGRGGFGPLGMATDALDLTPAPAPPVNAPSGPKAMREGRPNTGFFARVAPTPSVPPVAPTPQPEDSRSRLQEHGHNNDERSRSRSKHRSRKHRHVDDDEEYESEDSRRRRKDKEREKRHRNRRDRESKYDDDDAEESSRKGRSREESRDEGHVSRRHHDREDEQRSSRPHRDERRKSNRHPSRSPEQEASRNGDD
ncbi:hypothetical protein LTR33_015117, partial [Friedmanniomyces endolithicus]